MKARHAARELAMLALFQLEKHGSLEHAVSAQQWTPKSMQQLCVDAVRSLSEEACERAETIAQDLAAVSEYVLNAEIEHPDNLESPMEAVLKPVPIPSTREMLEKIEVVLQSAELLSEALRIPELVALSNMEEVRQYAHQLIESVLNHCSEIDTHIEGSSEGWKVSRMAKLDRCILRLATAEMLYVESVDLGVSIDEAVELAKQFSSEESFRFVNGVLGHVALAINDGKPVKMQTETEAIAAFDEQQRQNTEGFFHV